VLVDGWPDVHARADGLCDNFLAAAFVAFFTATTFLGLVLVVSGTSVPKPSALAQLPLWVWLD
jgi:uncharacterized membrane protein YdcZ (DUF606 family)